MEFINLLEDAEDKP